ncbi:hypothetical protein MASR2M48_20430 [Spirochaetota bacterium]
MKPLSGNIVVHIDAVAGSDAILERSYGATPAVVDKPLASGGMSDIEVTQMEHDCQRAVRGAGGCMEGFGRR